MVSPHQEAGIDSDESVNRIRQSPVSLDDGETIPEKINGRMAFPCNRGWRFLHGRLNCGYTPAF